METFASPTKAVYNTKSYPTLVAVANRFDTWKNGAVKSGNDLLREMGIISEMTILLVTFAIIASLYNTGFLNSSKKLTASKVDRQFSKFGQKLTEEKKQF